MSAPTDLQAIIRERDLAIGYLRREIEQLEAELQNRERFIAELLAELAGIG